MSWTIAPLTVADLPEIMQIERTVFASDAWSEQVMRSEITSPHGSYVGLHVDGVTELAGYAGVLAPAGAREADIQTIAIREAYRGRGFGRLLMEHLLQAARTRGATEVFLEVREDNPVARTLYERLGFDEIGRREKYYQPDGVAAIVMRRTFPGPSPDERRTA